MISPRCQLLLSATHLNHCAPRPGLQGGQAQRVALAIAIALCPCFLLLDEPTSACDPVSTRQVEQVLQQCGAGLIWVTHDPEQPLRVGGRSLELPRGLEISIARATEAAAASRS